MEFHENFQEINPKLFFSTQVCSKINKLEVNEPKPVKVIFDWIYNIIIMLSIMLFVYIILFILGCQEIGPIRLRC